MTLTELNTPLGARIRLYEAPDHLVNEGCVAMMSLSMIDQGDDRYAEVALSKDNLRELQEWTANLF